MAGSRAGPHHGGALLGGRQLAGFRIEAKDENPVQTLVRNHHESARRIENDLMRMGTGLLQPVRPGRTLQGDQLHSLSQRSVRPCRQHRDIARGVIGHQHEPAARIDRRMHAVAAAGLRPGSAASAARFRDPPRRPRHTFHRRARNRDSAGPAHSQERRIDQSAGELHVVPAARLRIHAVDVDAVAASIALRGGIAPYVCVNHRSCAVRRRGLPGCSRPAAATAAVSRARRVGSCKLPRSINRLSSAPP